MELTIIIIASAVASLITLFSGFGLGTILTPVFALFFPVEIAIAMTGIVHFSNNIFKVGLLGKYAEWGTIIRFGIPSVIGAVFGAVLLISLTGLEPIAEYSLAGRTLFIQPMKLLIAVVMTCFALAEILPSLQSFKPSRSSVTFGGFLSGFFGGLSGHQGALRSIFLLQYGMTKEQFLATGIIIACFVDVTRLSLYSDRLFSSEILPHGNILIAAVLSAFVGAYAGNRFLKKVTIGFVQKLVSVMLICIAAALGLGVI